MKLDRKSTVYITVVALIGLGIVATWRSGADHRAVRPEEIILPDLSPEARAGKVVFDAKCASCHGANAARTDKGPPFIHDIYNPGHHADAAFYLAVQRGVRRHHWRFGDMPALPDVTKAEVASIIHYVRELQAANGIKYRRHSM